MRKGEQLIFQRQFIAVLVSCRVNLMAIRQGRGNR